MTKKALLTLLQKESLCVLATTNLAGKPEAAVMAYATNDQFEVYMFTEPSTRKWANLTTNPQASLVVGGLKDDPTIQLDGKISLVEASRFAAIRTFVLSVHPEWQDYFSSPDGRWFVFHPSWARFSDFSTDPPKTEEIAL